MRSQWECLLQNLGEWQGSFTQLSPQGELLEDTPTVVSLQGLDNNQTMRQTISRLRPNQPIEEKVLEYSSLGRGVMFFEDGAFSQGSIQFSPFSEFGAELGLINGDSASDLALPLALAQPSHRADRRLRLVQIFSKTGYLERLNLIREKLAGTTTAERPHLRVEDLLGEWQGEAVTLYPDWRSPETYPTKLRIEKSNAQLTQQITINTDSGRDAHSTTRNISSTARIENSCLYFDRGPQPSQVLLLPDGASAASPQQITVGQAFFLELGWLLQPNQRQRLIRRYNDKGEWSSLTLVTEQKS